MTSRLILARTTSITVRSNFRMPRDIWEGVDNNKVDYISWAGGGSNKKKWKAAPRSLPMVKNTAYYYFKRVQPPPIAHLTI